MLALPDVIDGGGVKAVAGVKFAAAVPAFEFLGVLGVFFDFNIYDDARVGVLLADGLQNLRAVPAAAQFWNDREKTMFVMLPCVMEFENPQNMGVAAISFPTSA